MGYRIHRESIYFPYGQHYRSSFVITLVVLFLFGVWRKLYLSLYIHIPFCQTKCPYCDFNTYAKIEHLMPSYVEALCQELLLWSSVLETDIIETIFFGGGTPSYLPTTDLKKILDTVRTNFKCDTSEITIEVNPNDIDYKNIDEFLQIGINRVSIGTQSFQDSILKTLGRTHSSDVAIDCYRKLRQIGVDNISLDLMYGIPYQTFKHWEDSLQIASELDPDHLSLYCLTLEKNTPMQRLIDVGKIEHANDDLAADMYVLCEEFLNKKGYEQYEISNWSKPNRESKHNLRYWMNRPYLGVGPGAHSFLYKNRFNNINSPNLYISKFLKSAKLCLGPKDIQNSAELLNKIPSVENIEPVAKELEMGETMMLGLRLNRGIKEIEFKDRFGTNILDVFGKTLDDLIEKELLVYFEGIYKLTQKGRLLGNEVFSRFF